MSHTLKFQAPRSLSPHIAIFHPCALSRSSVTLKIIALPPPSVVLIPGPKAHRRLIPNPDACRCLDPSLRVRRRHRLPQVIRAPLPRSPLEHTAAIDLYPTSLRVHHCHPLPQALDMALSEGNTPPLPHVIVCVNLTELG
jgi:hypothetical protein